ncbi:class I SAM-dependent methyltransferase [Polynucleobacter paneuropaeus]|nr:class I SAM-dependent methyltransferase [Polynucleobacter paneuropaeus]
MRAKEKILNKFLLRGPYFPSHSLNKMKSEGNVTFARARFSEKRFRNLDFLLKERYCWMNRYIKDEWNVIEIGAGAGFSEFYLHRRPFMTDVVQNEWIDGSLDATDMDLEDESVDCLIASHNIHHFYSPYKFFRECERVLRPGGVVLIQELNTSILLRFLLKLMRHEGWSYEVNVFDPNEIANDPNDLWSANCAIPELLFDKPDKFEGTFSKLKIKLNQKKECLLFPISGGVIAKTKMPEFPFWFLKLVVGIDVVLVYIAPEIFAMGRSVVLEKT